MATTGTTSVCVAVALTAMLAVSPAALAGAVIRVDASGPDGGDGSTWKLAFNDLQDALGTADPGDEMWVAAGVYVPDGPAGREETFVIPSAPHPFSGERNS